MSDPFVGEIRLFSYDWIPAGWLPCDGRVLQVRDNPYLFVLIKNRYGGDGIRTFCLPDLRGRVLYGAENLMEKDKPGTPGFSFGEETVALTGRTVPPHGHTVMASSKDGTTVSMAGAGLAKAVPAIPDKFPSGAEIKVYDVADQAFSGAVPLHAETVSPAGQGKGHENMQPFQVIQYCICVAGEFPSRG